MKVFDKFVIRENIECTIFNHLQSSFFVCLPHSRRFISAGDEMKRYFVHIYINRVKDLASTIMRQKFYLMYLFCGEIWCLSSTVLLLASRTIDVLSHLFTPNGHDR